MNGWTHWGVGNKVEISDVVDNNLDDGGNETVATSGELQDKKL